MKLRYLTPLCVIGAALYGIGAQAAPAFSWANTITGTTVDGGDLCTYVGADSAGNVYAVGTVINGAFPNDYADIVITKYNSAGTLQWTRTYDRNGFDDVAFDAKVDGAGNVYVAGYSALDGTSTNTDVLALKVTSANVLTYANTYVPTSNDVDEYPYSIALTATGEVAIAGEAGGTAVGAGLPYDAAVYYVNSGGAFVWRRTYAGSLGDYDRFDEVVFAPGGDIVATGFAYNVNADAITARITTANVQVFLDTYNTAYVGGTAINENGATDLAVDGSGNAYIVGTTYKDTAPNDRQESFLRKLNAAGAVQWTSLYDGAATGITTANDVVVDGAGTAYVVGETTVGGTAEANANQYIRRVTTAGTQTHVTTRDQGFGDFFSSVGIASNGNVYAAGWSNLDGSAIPANKDGVIGEYAPATVAQNSVVSYNGSGNDWDEWLDMTISGTDIYVCGFTYSTFTDANALMAKYTLAAFINPASYTVVAGMNFGGNLASLFASDNNKVIVLLDEFSSNSSVDFFATSPTASPTSFKLFCETSASRNDLSFFSRVFNYTTNNFVQVDFRTSSLVDVAFTATATGTLSQLVGPASAVRSRHDSIPQADIDSGDGWTVSIDRWQWEIQ